VFFRGIRKVIRPDDQFDNGTCRVAQIRAVGIFVIPGKVLNDSFTIDQEFECLLINGKVFVLNHKSCLPKIRMHILCSEQGEALHPKKK
jgi:hypothetical protein